MLNWLRDKRYWIIGAAIAFAAILFVARKQQDATSKYKAHRAEYCAAFAATTTQKESCIEEKASAQDYLPWGYKLFVWPDGVGAWALIFTGFFVGSQAFETRKAANASAQSAMVAERAHNVQRNKEKPRVALRIDDEDLAYPQPFINISILFTCPTTAWVKSVRRIALILPFGEYGEAEILKYTGVISPELGDVPLTLTSDHTEAYTVHIRSKGGFNRFSQTTLDEFEVREKAIILAVRIIFEDAYGARDRMFTQIMESSQLKNFNGQTARLWRDGPAHLNWDKQAD